MRRRTFVSKVPKRREPVQLLPPLLPGAKDNSDSSSESDDHDTEMDPATSETIPDSEVSTYIRQNQAMLAWLVAVISVSLLLVCLYGGKSPSSVLHIQGVKELIDNTPRTRNNEYIVFFSRGSEEMGCTHIAMGKSKASPRIALSKAAAKLPREAHLYDWVKVDVVVGIAHKEAFDYVEQKPELSEWWYGIGLDWDKGWAFLPDEVFARALMDSGENLRWDHLIKLAQERNLKGWPDVRSNQQIVDDIETTQIQIDFFQTKAVFCDLSAYLPQALPLHHGHRLFSSLDSNTLTEAAKEAAKFLSRSVTESGKMTYQYKPRSDNELGRYSLLSQAAASFSMATSYRTWKDPALLSATVKSLEWLLAQTEDCPLPYDTNNLGKCVVDTTEDGTKFTLLGMNSLLLLALAEFMDAAHDPTHLTTSTGLAQWIVGAQRHDGSLVQRQQIDNYDLDEELNLSSGAGQAAFALSKLHNTVKRMGLKSDPAWSDVAVRAVEFVVANEENVDDESFINDRWMMYSIAEMRLWHINEGMVEFAMRGAKIARNYQYGDRVVEDEDRDKFGIFYDDPSVKTTAVMAEGLCAIYDLAVEQGRIADQELIFNAVSLAVRYTLQAQVRPEQAMFLKNPFRILGAFQKSIYDRQLTKIDYTQHNLAVIMCMVKALTEQEKLGNGLR